MTTAWDKNRRKMAPLSGCVGKARYPSREVAQGALRKLRTVYPGSYQSTVRPYRCPVCRRWHLGTEW